MSNLAVFCLLLLFAVANGYEAPMNPGVRPFGNLPDVERYDENSPDVEHKVIDVMFRDYNKMSRPVETQTEVVHIGMTLVVAQIVNLNGKNQIMKTSVWPSQFWKDERLAWNKTGLFHDPILKDREFRIPPEDVWQADIVLLNNIDGQYEPTYPVKMLIRKDGSITWMPPSIFNTWCQMDARHFPFDSQKCELVFGSWTYDSTKVKVSCQASSAQFGDPNSFYESAEWKINSVPCHESTAPIIGSDLNVSLVIFTFHVTRKPLFYQCWLITPTLIIILLVPLVFYLPVEAGEKLGLSISLTLTCTLPLMLCSKYMSNGGETVPMILQYIMSGMLLSSLSVMSSVIVVNIHYRSADTAVMPNWIKLVFVKTLPKYLHMERPSTKSDRKKKKLQKFLDKLSMQNGIMEFDADGVPISQKFNPGFITASTDMSRHATTDITDSPIMVTKNFPNNENSMTSSSAQQLTNRKNRRPGVGAESDNVKLPNQNRVHNSQLDVMGISRDLQIAYGCIEYIVYNLKSNDDSQKVSDDWQFVAMVVDRLFFIFFTLTCSILTTAVFIEPFVNYTISE